MRGFESLILCQKRLTAFAVGRFLCVAAWDSNRSKCDMPVAYRWIPARRNPYRYFLPDRKKMQIESLILCQKRLTAFAVGRFLCVAAWESNRSKCDMPVVRCLSLAERRQHRYFHHWRKCNTNPTSAQGFLFRLMPQQIFIFCCHLLGCVIK